MLGLFHEPPPRPADYKSVLDIIRRVRTRWRLRILLRGVAIVFTVGLVIFLVASVGLEQFRFSSGAIVAFRTLAYGSIGASIWFGLVKPLFRRVSDERVALYLEEHEPSLQGQVTTAVEFGGPGVDGRVNLSPLLVDRMVQHAVRACSKVDDGKRVDQRRLRRSSGWLAGATLASAVLVLMSPKVIRNGAPFLLRPFGTDAGSSPYSIAVTPGDTTMPRGADLKITADLVNFDADAAYLSVRNGDDQDWQRWPMTLDTETGTFDFLMFKVQNDAEFLVEASGVRSSTFHVRVADLPYVDRMDHEYRFPAYTGLSPQMFEDAGDIAALHGTSVLLSIMPTIPVAAGAIVVDEQDTIPLVQEAGRLTGQLVVRRNASYRVLLTSIDGADVVGSPDYFIDALDDQKPAIRFKTPGRDMKVTSIDEVFTEVIAEDDYGIEMVEFLFSVNGGEGRVISLFGPGGSRSNLTAGHTLYLEEFDLQPGDVVAYYARARDTRRVGQPQMTTTDIYFLDIRPFDWRYRQAEQQGGGGGGEPTMSPGELSRRQREIVAGTFNLVRDSLDYTADELQEHLTTLALSQGRLREEVETLVRRLEGRRVVELDSTFTTVADELPRAILAMEEAEEQLGQQRAEGALSPEQRAMQHLMRAEAAYREREVSQGGGGGGGGGQNATAEELVDLFDLELDKLRNQYESVERSERQQVAEQVDETLERLRELARRQQQENERMRARAQNLNSGGGGGQGQRSLADETEELARQLERLSREQQRPELIETVRELQQAAEAMRRAAANNQNGGAQGQSALDQLREARRLLEENRSAGLRQEVDDALRRAERLAQEQREMADNVSQLPAEPAARDRERLQQLVARKTEMASEVNGLEAEIDRLSRDASSEQPDASQQLREAAREMRDTRLGDKIMYSRGVLQARSNEYAKNFENQIQNDLDGLEARIRQARDAIGESRDQRLERALDEARDLVNALESMDERMEAAQQRGLGQEGQGGQGGQANDGTRGGTPGGDPVRGDGQISPDDARQFAQEMQVRRRELEALRERLMEAGVDVSDLGDVLRRMRALENHREIGEPRSLAELKEAIIPGLKEFEFKLRKEVGGIREDVFLTGSGEVPEEYRKLVEEYYKNLAKRGGGGN